MFDLTKVNWSKLYYFYLVGKCRNITTAARYANIDQSGMSRHMMSLEDELGVKLLLRNRDGVEFTEIGESIFKTVHKIVALTLEENQNIANIRKKISGTLRVLTTQSLARKFTNHIDKFYEKFPDIRLHINISRDFNTIDILNEHDIAVFAISSFEQDFEYVPYKKLKLALFASKEYLSKYGTLKKPKDLDEHRLISFSTSALPQIGFVDFHLTLGRKNREIREPYLQLGAADSLIAACEKGIGIIPYVDDEQFPLPYNLVKVLDEYYTEFHYSHFIFNKKQQECGKIKAFIEFFKNV